MKFDPSAMERRFRHRLIGNLLVPRPIALVSTISSNNIRNLAPYAMFGIISYNPTMVYITVDRRPGGSKKDTIINIEQTREFVVNMVVEEIGQQMNICSGHFPYGVDEFEKSGLTPIPSDLVKPFRVLESPVNFECRVTQILEFGKPQINAQMVLAEVLRFHVNDGLFEEDTIDYSKYRIVGRMGVDLGGRRGVDLYTRADLFEIKSPQELDCV